MQLPQGALGACHSSDAATEPERPEYSIGTLVSNAGQYQDCLASFHAAGFRAPECEFLHINNTAGNTFDAYSGLNRILSRSRGRYIVLCHQDIELPANGKAMLDARIGQMDARDPGWAVLGSAGGLSDGTLALHMTDPRLSAPTPGPAPVRCMSLDEAFLLVRADANLGLSRDLSGFHLYGTDLCLVADILGWSSWVIDFPLHHLSPGRMEPSFHAARDAMIAKYRRALRPRIVPTTCTTVPLTSSQVLGLLGRSSKGMDLWRRLLGRGL